MNHRAARTLYHSSNFENEKEKKIVNLASPGEGGTPRNDEADLGRREGLFVADLNIENAGLDNDRHREAIFRR